MEIYENVIVLPDSHSNPVNPTRHKQLPSIQFPPFKHWKSVGQTKKELREIYQQRPSLVLSEMK